jgi:hypothetical protein
MASRGITWPGYEGEERQFAGVPGTYGPGLVVTLESAGMTEDEAKAAIKGTPLKIVDNKDAKEATKTAKGGD